MENAETGGGSLMTTNLAAYRGKLVRLATPDLENDTVLMARWNQNSEYQQLSDWGPSRLYSPKQIREWMEKEYSNMFCFSIRTLAEDKTIGMLDLSGINWIVGDAWLGVGIGEPAYWGKGYGSDAVTLLLHFAFESLNLKRVSLNVFEYNERAIKSYTKLGFTVEGRLRQLLNRFDRRWDLIHMGILRCEWEACQRNFSGE
jgi:RimJ/RimL family protein N-acetyltransferase